MTLPNGMVFVTFCLVILGTTVAFLSDVFLFVSNFTESVLYTSHFSKPAKPRSSE